MLTLDVLIASLPARPDPRQLLQGFVPPPRFAEKRFHDYHPAHPSQAAALARLRAFAREIGTPRGGLLGRLRFALSRPASGAGLYLDGGFGVGKTHLLAGLWHASPGPKAYLSFDELVYTLGLLGLSEARTAFADQRLVAVDEWELDDPGNLKLALAFLRGALADGVRVVVTSNTLPLELGEGRFSQKDFLAEVEELAEAFEVLRVEGDDYRHRHFEADPGGAYFLAAAELRSRADTNGAGGLLVDFGELLAGLAEVHPIRYTALAESLSGLYVERITTIGRLPDALRWVHFIDTLYDSAVPFAASSDVALGELFPRSYVDGPYGKKVSRCLSRMEEMLAGAGAGVNG